MTTVWKVGAGDAWRDYRRLFLDFGIACVGPGDCGPYPENAAAYNDPVIDGEPNWAYREWMRDFCERIQVGDLLVMRGTSSSCSQRISSRSYPPPAAPSHMR